MAAKLVSTFSHYEGSSSDVKPFVGMAYNGSTITRADLQHGSQFLEMDTGISWRYDGANWYRVQTDGVQAVIALGLVIEAVKGLHRTIEQMRVGMIAKDTCSEVDIDAETLV